MFVYDPRTDTFYMKVIIVDVKSGTDDTYYKNSCSVRPVELAETEPKYDTSIKDRKFEAFLNDSNTVNLDIYRLAEDKDQLVMILESIQNNYDKLL